MSGIGNLEMPYEGRAEVGAAADAVIVQLLEPRPR